MPIQKERKKFACGFEASSDTLLSAHVPSDSCSSSWWGLVGGGNLALLEPGSISPGRVGIRPL